MIWEKEYIYIYVYEWLGHFAVEHKLTEHCKSTIIKHLKNTGCISAWWHHWRDPENCLESHHWSGFRFNHCTKDGAWIWPRGQERKREMQTSYEEFPLTAIFLQLAKSQLACLFLRTKIQSPDLITSHFPLLFIQTISLRKLIFPVLFKSNPLSHENLFSVSHNAIFHSRKRIFFLI